MRVILTHRGVYNLKNMNKTTQSQLQKPSSNIIVDPGYFKKTDLLSRIANKFKNSNSLFEIRRNVDGFSVHDFEKSTLDKYRLLCSLYQQHNYREISNLLVDDLLHKFKFEVKGKTKKDPIQLGWNLINDASSVKVVQARIHQEKLSSIKVSDRWFQITCKFSNSQGEQVYNVLEKHEKNNSFKFVKFDL